MLMDMAPLPPSSQHDVSRAPIPDSLLALAPRHLPNHRQERYQGDDVCVSLDQMAERDQALVRDLYRVLTDLLFAIADPSTDDAGKWRDVDLWLQKHQLATLIEELRQLGRASYARTSNEELAKAVHDIRGGALSALLGRLQLLGYLPRDENRLKTLFILVRDHLKIMRNALTGLDDPRRNADRKPKSHDMKLILDKWHDSVVESKWQNRPVRMSVDCRHEGAMSECCMESAALDRIFYNLANNACRHVVGERIDMVIFPIPEPPGECLRFVLSNEVGEEDAAYLNSLRPTEGKDSAGKDGGPSLLALFTPAVSSTGSGFGLTVVADFVVGAFGLRDTKVALREGYVGAILDGRTFRVWFHWPIASNELPQKSDDFHRPDQSLSEPEN